MKNRRTITRFCALAVLTVMTAVPAVAQNFLLKIDTSNPTAVTFTTTGASASLDDSTTTAGAGINLIGFFTASALDNETISGGTLIGGNSGVTYDNWLVDSQLTSFEDLNLFVGAANPDNTNVQDFTTSTPAFTGSVTIDMSGQAANLPTSGFGDLYSGTQSEPGVLIGQWEISTTPTPEPGTNALLALGALAAGLMLYRRAGQYAA